MDLIDATVFEDARPKLLGLSYRILGLLSDAEDAVQDTYVKWQGADRNFIDKPGAWLTTVCTRRCLDMLRAAHRSRVDYVGAWLPEPIHAVSDTDPEGQSALASSLATAFLLMLERLSPKERAAYLLHDIFDIPYPDIAESLDLREDACRKLVSRAKRSIDRAKVRQTVTRERQNQLLAAFQEAVSSGATAPLAQLLSDDIRLHADSGGKVASLRDVLHGRDRVLRFIADRLRGFWSAYDWRIADINGAKGVVLTREGQVEATANFGFDDRGRVTDIFVMRNPEKLTRLDAISIH